MSDLFNFASFDFRTMGHTLFKNAPNLVCSRNKPFLFATILRNIDNFEEIKKGIFEKKLSPLYCFLYVLVGLKNEHPITNFVAISYHHFV